MNNTHQDHYISDLKQKLGPMTLEEARAAITEGLLDRSAALIWKEGMDDWTRVQDYPPLQLETSPKEKPNLNHSIPQQSLPENSQRTPYETRQQPQSLPSIMDGNLIGSLAVMTVPLAASSWDQDLAIMILTGAFALIGFVWFVVFLCRFLIAMNKIDPSIGVVGNVFFLIIPFVNLVGWFLVPMRISKSLSNSSGYDWSLRVPFLLGLSYTMMTITSVCCSILMDYGNYSAARVITFSFYLIPHFVYAVSLITFVAQSNLQAHQMNQQNA